MQFPKTSLNQKFTVLLGLKSEHEAQFELAIKENNLPFAYELAIDNPQKDKWRQLHQLSKRNKNMNMGQNCHLHYIGHIKGKYRVFQIELFLLI